MGTRTLTNSSRAPAMGRREREAKRLLGGAEGPVQRALHNPLPAGLPCCVVVTSCAAPASLHSSASWNHRACTRVHAVKSFCVCVCLCAARQQNPNVNAQLLALQRLTQAGPRRIGPYSSQQSILMVGEGDFSFALAVASAVGGDRLVCTSLDKATQLQVKYDNRVNGILGTLHGLGAKTHHNVDATNLKVCVRPPATHRARFPSHRHTNLVRGGVSDGKVAAAGLRVHARRRGARKV